MRAAQRSRSIGGKARTKERYLKDFLKPLTSSVEACNDIAVYDLLILDQKRLSLPLSVLWVAAGISVVSMHAYACSVRPLVISE